MKKLGIKSIFNFLVLCFVLPLELLGTLVVSAFDWICLLFTAFTIYIVWCSVETGIIFKAPIQYLPILVLLMFVFVSILLWYLLIKKMKEELKN